MFQEQTLSGDHDSVKLNVKANPSVSRRIFPTPLVRKGRISCVEPRFCFWMFGAAGYSFDMTYFPITKILYFHLFFVAADRMRRCSKMSKKTKKENTLFSTMWSGVSPKNGDFHLVPPGFRLSRDESDISRHI